MPHALDGLLWSNPDYLDAMYRRWTEDPSSVDPGLARLFAQGTAAGPPAFLTPRGAVPQGVVRHALDPGIQIYDLIHTYREYGHLIADIDPLGRSPREHPFLSLDEFAFTEADLDRVVACEGFHGAHTGSGRDFLAILRETYCGPIGVEYMDLMHKDRRDWLQERMEPIRNRPRFATEHRRRILHQVLAADSFEETLHRMYPGAKRFSLEGGTTLITLLHELAAVSLESGIEQMVLGMAHRGRLNVLAQFMQKPLEHIMAEFEGRPLAAKIQGYGDVKYHLGYSSDYRDEQGRTLHLSLAFNPSHLEYIDPVVQGIVRAKQDQAGDSARMRVVPVLLHGDAAFSGQGVVAETFNLAALRGYHTGGTVHIIVNNQVGFTTDPEDSKSTRYVSDLAKMVRAPVFHVNADHPEAVALVGQFALGYRQRFHEDVVIDLVCFRRHGHNELDDATFTQPLMVERIKRHEPVSKIYGDKLQLGGVVSAEETRAMVAEVKQALRQARDTAREMPEQPEHSLGGKWTGLKAAGDTSHHAATAVPEDTLQTIARGLTRVPEGFTWHSRLEKIMARRADMVLAEDPTQREVDWGCAEALACGSLVLEGTRVRFSGQDVMRGTFSHRHATYVDQRTGDHFTPLDHLGPDQAAFEIINSPLSEIAVLGFEYGYSSADPWALVVWEAQFGDFANAAQVIIDQMIATSEYKWGRMSGLVLLLPHGYEGQGPEHSSARLERFLELCAESNIQVGNFTTPAQYFHALRRQMRRDFRKPLIVMSPKSLLRHPRAVSPLDELVNGHFREAMDDPTMISAEARAAVDRVLLCSGKVYYPLDEARTERGHSDVALVRIEQLYPFPQRQARAILASYPNLRTVVWVQEEPRNMGAWRNLVHQFERTLPAGVKLDYAGRDSRAATATGAYDVHIREEAELIDRAFSRDARPRIVRRKEG
ncbi:MAG TPA: 2-oxoglutarate dehydrogenase E1 component [Kofleriaceae bacterium]|nr:2-oxoglutarate dehydrogenase E1 component [Kofleriaceae bacterium]